MKSAFAIMFLSLTTMAASNVEVLQANQDKNYETFTVYASKAAAVIVSVDYKMVKTDCHGLEYSYKVSPLNKETRTVLVSKHAMAHTMNMCPPMLTQEEQDGVKFTLKADKYGGVYAEVIAPAGAVVTKEVVLKNESK